VTTVSSSTGAVRGVKGDVLSFRGIPFAAPPNRFEPPRKADPWDGDLDATKYRAAAPQADRRSTAFDGRTGAGHSNERPFVFGALDDPGMADIAGSGPGVEALSTAMQDAWLAFARSGDPSTEALAWPRFDPERRATMLLGDHCRVEDDPYRLERLAWQAPE
jgi:carboxylesterase type B